MQADKGGENKAVRQPVASPWERFRATSPGAVLVVVLAGTLVWAVWSESFSAMVLAQGAFLSALALLVTNRYLLKAPYQQVFRIAPLTLARYVVVLIIAIFESGLHAIAITLTGRLNVGVIDLPTAITNPFHGVLVANAITLTPGTVTIDYHDGSFKVIWIECLTADPEVAGELIKGRFERVFLPVDKGGAV